MELGRELEGKSVLGISGKFDNEGGRAFNRGNMLLQEMWLESLNLKKFNHYDGGSLEMLERIFEEVKGYDLVLWFVDNANLSELKQVKRKNPKALLVSMINNNEEYSFGDLMRHSLSTRSNLLVELNGKNEMRILDPLGNEFDGFGSLTIPFTLRRRCNELLGYTRVESFEVEGDGEVPDDGRFFDNVKNYAGRFSHWINENMKGERFMGNASFRCESGFPSFRNNGKVYVSMRNVDKKQIGKEGFVVVEPEFPIKYYGKNKPSVDTPVQLKLYDYYKNINYMIHGHVYVEEAKFTDRIIPCGALEEVDEIIKVNPDKESRDFAVNLRGHGSIVLVSKPESFKYFYHCERKMPERHLGYDFGGRIG